MTDMELTALNIKSARYYGPQLQMNHFTEELAELIQAVTENSPEQITEEIADVEVMVEQMRYLLLLYDDEIAKGENYCHRIINQANRWDKSIESCIWVLADPIKQLNKLRLTNSKTGFDLSAEADTKRMDAKHRLEHSIGALICYIGWLTEKYEITADAIRAVKVYKVQRTRDRIAHEEEKNNG